MKNNTKIFIHSFIIHLVLVDDGEDNHEQLALINFIIFIKLKLKINYDFIRHHSPYDEPWRKGGGDVELGVISIQS